MPGPKFDITDGDFIFGNNDLGFDTDGDLMLKVGKNVYMDMNDGELHIVAGFDDDDDTYDFFNHHI